MEVKNEINSQIVEYIKQRLLKEQFIVQKKITPEEMISFDEFMSIYINLKKKYSILSKKLTGSRNQELEESKLQLKKFIKKYSNLIMLDDKKINDVIELISVSLEDFKFGKEHFCCKENEFIIKLLISFKNNLDTSNADKDLDLYQRIVRWILYFNDIADKSSLQGEINFDADGLVIKDCDFNSVIKIKDFIVETSVDTNNSIGRRTAV